MWHHVFGLWKNAMLDACAGFEAAVLGA